MTKFIFVTGGVVSSLGKGIAAASLGAILESRGLRITLIKLDPYINVDPGTMSPFQHGEVFVTHDGAETDLDLGHYERFVRMRATQFNYRRAWRAEWSRGIVLWRDGGGAASRLFACVPRQYATIAAAICRPNGMAGCGRIALTHGAGFAGG